MCRKIIGDFSSARRDFIGDFLSKKLPHGRGISGWLEIYSQNAFFICYRFSKSIDAQTPSKRPAAVKALEDNWLSGEFVFAISEQDIQRFPLISSISVSTLSLTIYFTYTIPYENFSEMK